MNQHTNLTDPIYPPPLYPHKNGDRFIFSPKSSFKGWVTDGTFMLYVFCSVYMFTCLWLHTRMETRGPSQVSSSIVSTFLEAVSHWTLSSPMLGWLVTAPHIQPSASRLWDHSHQHHAWLLMWTLGAYTCVLSSKASVLPIKPSSQPVKAFF